MFSPDRFQISTHGGPSAEDGYDVFKLKDSYRSLHVLKNRFGRSNMQVGLAFYGEVDQFYELPSWDNMTHQIYKDIVDRKYKS